MINSITRGLKSFGNSVISMVDAEWVEAEVRKIYPTAEIAATDLTGNGDHWFVKVVDPLFEGMRPLPRQRPILSHFKQFIQSNVVHALDLKCWTPEQEKEKEGDGLFHPHQQDDFVGIHVRRVRTEE